jgi:hypothetical protein
MSGANSSLEAVRVTLGFPLVIPAYLVTLTCPRPALDLQRLALFPHPRDFHHPSHAVQPPQQLL